MFSKRKSKRHYLYKMRCGQITDKEVAQLYNTSESDVQQAFISYTQKKKPFNNDKNNMVVIEILISCLSMFLVLFTLLEMQVARNNAYMPDLYFEDTMFIVTWDENGLKNSDFKNKDLFEKYSHVTEYIDSVPRINLTNIGVGTAKEIKINWKHKYNLKELTNYLYALNEEADFYYQIDSFTIIKSFGKTVQTTARPFYEITYMKNESQSKKVMVPVEYLECIRHICYNYNETGLNIPNLRITVSYNDIQGKEYYKDKYIQLSLNLLTQNPDGSGYAIITIREI